jgi:tetratricopeptide (TPR) repeat protein
MSALSRGAAREQWARHRDRFTTLLAGQAPLETSQLFPVWYAAQNALRVLVGLSDELGDTDGQEVISQARQAGVLTLDETHTLLDALGAATAARANPDGHADPQALALIQHAVRVVERVVHDDPLAPPSIPAAAPSPTSTVSPPSLPPLAMPPAPPAPSSGARTALLVVGGVALLIAGAGIGAFVMRGNAALAPIESRALAACRTAFDAGDRQGALQACDAAAQVARAQPDHAIALVYLARLKRSAGDVQGAIADADLAQRLLPQNGIALRELGAAFLDANDVGEARRAFVTAVQSDATDRLAMAGLACALHRLGREDEALRWRDRAQRTAFDACLRGPIGR